MSRLSPGQRLLHKRGAKRRKLNRKKNGNGEKGGAGTTGRAFSSPIPSSPVLVVSSLSPVPYLSPLDPLAPLSILSPLRSFRARKRLVTGYCSLWSICILSIALTVSKFYRCNLSSCSFFCSDTNCLPWGCEVLSVKLKWMFYHMATALVIFLLKLVSGRFSKQKKKIFKNPSLEHFKHTPIHTA